jgi:dienelactone hydrolase
MAVSVLALIAGGLVARPYWRGLSFVLRSADVHGTARRLADLGSGTEREREITIPTSRGPLQARVYDPQGTPRRAVLLVSGLHPAGIDEPRLVALARELARDDLLVVSPDIPELAESALSPAITDAIEEGALWLATESGLARDHRVGLIGIGFSGGLSVVAAGRSSLAGHLAYVLSLGGHDDLSRALMYLCTGSEPRPTHELRFTGGTGTVFVRAPHHDSVAVILLGVADRLVPAPQVEALRKAIRRFLWASYLDRLDRPEAQREFEALRDVARTMPQPSATLLRYVNEGDVVHLGARLLPYIGLYGRDPSLSPSKSPKPSVPIFLLHATEDNVIPAVESEYLANELRGHTPVRMLMSGLIQDAESRSRMHTADVLDLASFWGDLLGR